MGSGIAQLACQAGARTLLHDPDPQALERGIQRINDHLRRSADRGRLTPEQADHAAALLEPAPELEQLAPCELVIEAAPERLEIKRRLFASVADVVGPECVLATNTSSLLVTALADAAGDPSRVVGMHFFNPPPLMRLLEVVAGAESSQRALTVARAAGEAMGKLVIDAVDGPGFIVNRCNRPFGLEALKLLQERVAEIRRDRHRVPTRRWLPDGAVRAHGPRGRRRRSRRVALLLRAELRGATLAAVADHRQDGRRRAAREEGGPRVLRVPGRWRAPPVRPGAAARRRRRRPGRDRRRDGACRPTCARQPARPAGRSPTRSRPRNSRRRF